MSIGIVWRLAIIAGVAGTAALVTAPGAGGGQLKPGGHHAGAAGTTELEGPLSFEPNRGQADSRVKFVARGPGYTLFVTPDAATLSFVHVASLEDLRNGNYMALTVVGANLASTAIGVHELLSKSSYFLGTDVKNWHTEIPTFASVQLQGIYPGIDLTYQGGYGRLEYDFVITSAGDPGRITVDIMGARQLQVNPDGDLMAQTAGTEICFHRPVAYQETNGRKQYIDARYRLRNNRVSFLVGSYDRTRPLRIDPVLSYARLRDAIQYQRELSDALCTGQTGYDRNRE